MIQRKIHTNLVLHIWSIFHVFLFDNLLACVNQKLPTISFLPKIRNVATIIFVLFMRGLESKYSTETRTINVLSYTNSFLTDIFIRRTKFMIAYKTKHDCYYYRNFLIRQKLRSRIYFKNIFSCLLTSFTFDDESQK